MSENPRGLVYCGGHNLPPLVEIGLNVWPKTGGEGGLAPTPACDSPVRWLDLELVSLTESPKPT